MPSPADPALRDAAANPAHPALAPFPRRRESIVASATSSPTGVIPAHAGIQWRCVRSEAGRSLRESRIPCKGVIPAQAGIHCRAGAVLTYGRHPHLMASSRRTPGSSAAAYAPKRGARCALLCAPQTAFRPACGRPSKGGFACPKPPLHPPKGTPGSRRAHFLCARSPGKDARARAAKQLGHPCPRTVWLYPSRGRHFPATSRGPGLLTRHPWLVGAATPR